MNEGIEKGGRGLTHASAGLVAQADEAEAHLLAGSPPLFVFPGSLMLGTGSWDSCALSADILGRELCILRRELLSFGLALKIRYSQPKVSVE